MDQGLSFSYFDVKLTPRKRWKECGEENKYEIDFTAVESWNRKMKSLKLGEVGQEKNVERFK